MADVAMWLRVAVIGGAVCLVLFYLLFFLIVGGNLSRANRRQRMSEWLDEVENQAFRRKW